MSGAAPKRGARCDCGAHAIVQLYRWSGCASCTATVQAVSARWKAEKQARDAAEAQS